MNKILVLGAGKSASTLIRYLLTQASTYNWEVIVADVSKETALQKIDGHAHGKALALDIKDEKARQALIAEAVIVLSVLPAQFHLLIAKDCLQFGKHLITPSYVSKEQKALDGDFKKANLLFMGEMGLDPGIDHMSLMKSVDELKKKGARLKAIRSFCGALITPESNTNPWQYKFTWSPMNVVLAGKGIAQYLRGGKPTFIPYNQLFQRYELHTIEEHGTFESYANRNSIKYIDKYGLQGVPTFIRGTLRNQGYCAAWNVLVQLGLTNHELVIHRTNCPTYNHVIAAFLPLNVANKPLAYHFADFLGLPREGKIMQQLLWLGIFEKALIKREKGTPAELLYDLLIEKWKLKEEDKDMIVMLHKLDYELDGENKQLISSMIMTGEDNIHTALSQTVGLPMGIMAKLLLTTDVSLRGVQIPLDATIYEPVLAELADYGITFKEVIK